MMQVIQSISEMQQKSFQAKQQAKKIAFVPTMGSLHEGHLTLVDAAKKHADLVVMSIFVNPTQFGPHEDFEKYPRDLTRDSQLAQGRGVDILFCPKASEVYPQGDQTSVIVTEVTRGLCGPFRPGHFRGVATVVAKLFSMVMPEVACFGEKDYQQLATIRRMVKDLHFPIEIIGVPTAREKSGLAMSSRNTYLSAQEKKAASQIYASMISVQKKLHRGEKKVAELIKEFKLKISQASMLKIEYAEIVDLETLASLEEVTQNARMITAVYLGQTRLIDNIELEIKS